MDELFAKYERELVILRSLCRDYAQRYPKVAAKLQMGGDGCDDPHVERLIQSVALLCARVTKRLDDSYPQFTEALLELVLPHYLRPFPSCAIAQATSGTAKNVGGSADVPSLPRASMLETAEVRGIRCMFQSAYKVAPSAAVLTAASFDSLIRPPAAIRLMAGVTSSLNLAFEAAHRNAPLSLATTDVTRLYIDGDPSFCATLRDVLFMHTHTAYLQVNDEVSWTRLPTVPIKPVGFAEDEALIPFGARSHVAYRILAEYFAFPEKFNFFDVDIPAALAKAPAGLTRFTLHLAVSGLRSDSDQARMLADLSAQNLRHGCTPVVNLFRRPGVPINIDQRSADYTLLADSCCPQGFEVYALDKVQMVRQCGKDTAVEEFRPFYSMRHGEELALSGGRYWLMRHDETLAACSPGHEKAITLVNAKGDVLDDEPSSLSIELTCTNRDLPCQLRVGAPDGDLFVPGATGSSVIRFSRRPSRPLRLVNGANTHWRLISHLALNHQSLVQGGAEGLRELLTLYDLAQSPVSRRQIDAIADVRASATTAWIRHKRGSSLAHGMEMRVSIDEEAFVGAGVHLFAQVLDHFLGMYVQLNSFVELVLLSHHSGKELFRCAPRSGSMQLV